jgi:Ca2+-binding RTX toxin-like protein
MAVINGTAGDNVLTGTIDADQINGLEGNDVINALTRPTLAGSGIDVVDGGDGIDTLVVDASSETQAVSLGTGLAPRFAVNSASGNFDVDAYNMEIVKFTGGSGDDSIDTGDSGGTVNGSGGIDSWTADLSGLFSDVAFTLGSTTKIVAAGLTSILNIERINLSTGAGDDTVTGGAQADTINTGDGNDVIDAKARPTLAGSGIDVVDGGDGTDTLIVNASSESQSVFLSVGNAPTFAVNSDSGNFDVDAYNMEKVKFTGGSGADSISTGSFGGTVNGGGGIDHWLADLGFLTNNLTFTLGATTAIAAAGLTSITNIERIDLLTGSGNDTITGGARADLINTGDGDDTIDAKTRIGGGVDVVDGGAGIDTLVVNAAAVTQSVTL